MEAGTATMSKGCYTVQAEREKTAQRKLGEGKAHVLTTCAIPLCNDDELPRQIRSWGRSYLRGELFIMGASGFTIEKEEKKKWRGKPKVANEKDKKVVIN